VSSAHDDRVGLVLASFGVLAFSFSLPMTKIADRGLDATITGIGRAAPASILAAIALTLGRVRRPSRNQVLHLMIAGAGVVVGFPMLVSYALLHTPSQHGSVVTGLLPLTTAGAAVLRAGERPSLAYWACSALGFAAVLAFVIHEGGGSLHRADLLLVLAVVSASTGYTEGALLARQMPGWQVISWVLIVASPLTWTLTVLAVVRHHPHATTNQWAAFGYLAVVTMFFSFFAWYAGLARAGIARAGQLQLAQPVLATLWGWPLLGEHLTGAAFLTIAVVLGAVALGRRATIAVARPAAVEVGS
jgi:drug/metabolite transporter (DMT)-like permease